MSSIGMKLLFRLSKNKFHNFLTRRSKGKKLTSITLSLSLIILFTITGYSGDNGNTTIQSFSKAKKILLRQVYRDHKTTFYCD
jgi:hypothetical protein